MNELIIHLLSQESEASRVRQRMANLSEKVTLEQCVNIVSAMADLVLISLLDGAGLELDKKESQVLCKHQTFRHGLALYLDNLVLHNPKHPELKFRKRVSPYAKLSKSILGLATGLEEDHWLLKQYFVSPKLLWLRCEFELCRDAMREDGLLASLGLDATSPTIKGKLDFRETNQEYMESFDVKAPFDQEKLDRAVGRSQCSRREMDRGIWENPLYYLTLKSYLKAKDDVEFDIDYFQPYQRAWASVRNSTKSSDVQYLSLDAYGNLLTSERHTNRRSRGFSK
jgi:hypothetical protein